MEKLFENISFIGGIHGVGKSTICKTLCPYFNLEHLLASEVLRWAELNDDLKNKKVQNIPLTQSRLINGLQKRTRRSSRYLLDGHYCLLNKTNKIERIPFETFEVINPISLHLIIGSIDIVKQRLEARDMKTYDFDLLKEMQDEETEYAKELSKKLSIELSVGKEEDFSAIIKSLRIVYPTS